MEFTRNEIVKVGFEERRFCILYGILVLINIAFLFLDVRQVGIIVRLPVIVIASLLLAFFTYKFAKSLKKNTALCVVSSIFVMIPFIGIILVLVFSGEATRLMRQAGLPVGLLGAPKKKLLEFAAAEGELSLQDNESSIPYVIPEEAQRKKQRKTELCIVAVCFFLLGLIIFSLAWVIVSHEAPKQTLRQQDFSIEDIKKALKEGKQVTVRSTLFDDINENLKKDKPVRSSIRNNTNAFEKDNFDPNACSRETIGKKVLYYLWCSMGMCRGTKERIVKDGHFSVRLIGYWQKEPTISKIKDWDVRYRFMNEDKKNNKQWISIEYMNPPENMSTNGDIGTWVDMPRMITGKPSLDIPDEQDFTVLKFLRVNQVDDVFMQKHGLKQMTSYVGTIKIDDTVCCLYIVLMQKGRESWKMEVVFPASYHKGPVEKGAKVFTPIVTNDEELSLVFTHPFNMNIAGMFMGHFKILE